MTYCLNDYDFETLSKTEPDPKRRLRLLGLQHLKEGRKPSWVADALKKTSETIRNWLKVFEAEGLDGLSDKSGRGSKPYLAKEERKKIREEIIQLQESREGGRITGQDIVDFLKENYDVKFHINSIYRFLKQLDLVWITGRSVHPKANLEEQENFKKEFQESRKRKYSSKCAA